MVNIVFETFALERSVGCRYDAVKVYDGPDETHPLIASLCGTQLPRPIESSRNEVFVKFESDTSDTAAGFVARFSAKEYVHLGVDDGLYEISHP